MILRLGSFLVIISSILSAQTFAADDTRKDWVLSQVERQLERRDIPAYLSSLDHIVEWCDVVEGILQDTLGEARSLIAREQLIEADELFRHTLEGLSLSFSRSPEAGELAQPFTQRWLDRALYLDSELRKLDGAYEEPTLAARLLFWEAYIGFIIQAENALDAPVYRNLYSSCSCCDSHSLCGDNCSSRSCSCSSRRQSAVAALHRRYLELSSSQLQLLVNTFTSYGHRSGYRPLGNPEVFRSMASNVSRMVAEDLGQNVFQYNFPCQIEELMDIHHDLASSESYRNDRRAVDDVSRRILHVARLIRSGSSCR